MDRYEYARTSFSDGDKLNWNVRNNHPTASTYYKVSGTVAYNQYKLEDGELCMRGDPVMLGYYKDPEATAEVLDAEGWFHTGDIARVEPDGYMYLTGRKKNVIILGSGENVSPEELEKLLVPCADIQE